MTAASALRLRRLSSDIVALALDYVEERGDMQPEHMPVVEALSALAGAQAHLLGLIGADVRAGLAMAVCRQSVARQRQAGASALAGRSDSHLVLEQ